MLGVAVRAEVSTGVSEGARYVLRPWGSRRKAVNEGERPSSGTEVVSDRTS